MNEHYIDLTDGTRLEIKLNFGTLYYLQKCKGFYRIVKKVEKAEKNGVPKEKALTETESFDMAANIIYAVLRSNGRSVKFDEALSLVPPDASELTALLQGFQDEYERYSKKKTGEDIRDAEVIEMNWAEYMMAARKMGMSEQEFWHSDPIFFNECYEIYQRDRENEVRALYGR